MKRTPFTDTDLDIKLADYLLTGDQIEVFATEFYGTLPVLGALDMPVIKVRFKGEDRVELAKAFESALAGFERLTS